MSEDASINSNIPAQEGDQKPKPKEHNKKKSKLRGQATDDHDTRISKSLSYLLRHGAQKESLKMRADGFVRVDDLVRLLEIYTHTNTREIAKGQALI